MELVDTQLSPLRVWGRKVENQIKIILCVKVELIYNKN
jgi:hypothetical protein